MDTEYVLNLHVIYIDSDMHEVCFECVIPIILKKMKKSLAKSKILCLLLISIFITDMSFINDKVVTTFRELPVQRYWKTVWLLNKENYKSMPQQQANYVNYKWISEYAEIIENF